MDKEKRVFSECFKQKVVEEVNSGRISKEGARRRYGIAGKSTVLKWQRNFAKYGRCSLILSTDNQLTLSKKKPSSESSREELEARIKKLERELEDEQLRSEAYSRIIDIAERTSIFLFEKSAIPSNP